METHEGHHEDSCFWCLLMQLQKFMVSIYLDEVLGTPGRTLGLKEGGPFG